MRSDPVRHALGAAARAAARGLRHVAALAAACALASLVPVQAARADEAVDEPLMVDTLPPEAPAHATLDAPLDKTIPLRAQGPVGRVVVSQPELLEAGLAGPRDIYLIGRDLGATNLLVYDTAGRLTQTLDVRIGYDAQTLREDLAVALPDERIAVTPLASGLLLEGDVSSPAAADTAVRLAQATAPDGVVSRLAVRGVTVRVDVRVVEVSQRRLQEVGAGLALGDGRVDLAVATGPLGPTPAFLEATLDTSLGQRRLQAALRALEDAGEARVVAEPTLVTRSGEAATFRAGGELPMPVPSDQGDVVIEFRPYGAALDIRPEVRANGTIRLEMLAELSEPDPLNQLSISGVRVPAMLVRRVATTADLRDGETILIAGLLEDGQRGLSVSSPGLSKIPLLRTVLRTAQSRDTRRELAILVTPHVDADASTPVAGPRSTTGMVPESAASPPAAVQPAPPARHADARPAGPRPTGVRGLVADVRSLLAPPVRWIGGKVRGLLARARGPVLDA